MKKILLTIIIIACLYNCYAQDTVKKKNRLTGNVVETYYVLKTDKNIKNGLYQAIYKRKIPLASGNYVNNKKVGIWHFYDTHGGLIENMNYDSNTLLYEKPDDALSQIEIQYAIDATVADSDRVTKPIKPGGRYYGYIPFITAFKLSYDYIGTDPSLFSAVLEILVSPGGRLADLKVHIKSTESERTTTFSPELFSDEDRLFIPATVNKKPVMSRIFVRCTLTDNGELDIF